MIEAVRPWTSAKALAASARVLASGYAIAVFGFFVTAGGGALDRAVVHNALTDDEQRRLSIFVALGLVAACAYVAAFARRGEAALEAASCDAFLLVPLGVWPLYEANVDVHVRLVAVAAMIALTAWSLHLFATRSTHARRIAAIDTPTLERAAPYWAAIAGLLHGAYMASIATKAYRILFSGWDLAIFSQIHWNITTTGVPWSTIYTDETFDHYAIHFSPILHLSALLYALHRSPATLYVLENLALGLGALPAYLAARKLTGRASLGLVVAAAYLLNPCAPGLGFHEFHEIVYFPALCLALVWAVETERRRLTWVFVALTLMVREDIGAYLAVLGVFWWMGGSPVRGAAGADAKKALAKKLVPIAAGYVVLVNVVVMPLLRGQGGYFLDRRFDGLFRAGKQGLGTTLETVATNPLYVLEYVASYPEKWKFLAVVLMPVAFLPLVRARTAMLVVPGILFCVLSSFAGQYWIDLHYTGQLIPLLVYASVVVIASLTPPRRGVAAVTMLVATCLLAGKFGRNPVLNGPLIKGELEHHSHIYGDKAAAYHALAASVPKDACVRATGNLLVPLAERRHAYIVPWGKMCDWAFIDYDKQARQEPSSTPAERAWVLEKLRSGEWGVVYGDERVVLMAKAKPTTDNERMIARIEAAQADDPPKAP